MLICRCPVSCKLCTPVGYSQLPEPGPLRFRRGRTFLQRLQPQQFLLRNAQISGSNLFLQRIAQLAHIIGNEYRLLQTNRPIHRLAGLHRFRPALILLLHLLQQILICHPGKQPVTASKLQLYLAFDQFLHSAGLRHRHRIFPAIACVPKGPRHLRLIGPVEVINNRSTLVVQLPSEFHGGDAYTVYLGHNRGSFARSAMGIKHTHPRNHCKNCRR
ncbi:hypothetical protein D3C75_874370 [compost metagenome]